MLRKINLFTCLLILCFKFLACNETQAKKEKIKIKKGNHAKYVARVPRGAFSKMQHTEEAHFSMVFITPKVRAYLKSKGKLDEANIPAWDKSELLSIYVIPIINQIDHGTFTSTSYTGGPAKKIYFKDKKNEAITCSPLSEETIPLKGNNLEYMYRTYWRTGIARSHSIDIDDRGVIPFFKAVYNKDCLSKLEKRRIYLESAGRRHNLKEVRKHKVPLVMTPVTTLTKDKISKKDLDYLLGQI